MGKLNNFRILDETVNFEFDTSKIQDKFDALMTMLSLSNYKITTKFMKKEKTKISDGFLIISNPFTQISVENGQKVSVINFHLDGDNTRVVTSIIATARFVDKDSGPVLLNVDSTEEDFNNVLDQISNFL